MLPNIIDLNQLLQPVFIAKAIALLLLFFYAIFAIVILNQVKTMNNLIKISAVSMALEILAILHILAVISLFVLTLVIL